MLNGIVDASPPSCHNIDALIRLRPGRAGERRDVPSSNPSIALVTTSTPLDRLPVEPRLHVPGSAPNSIRDALIV